MALPMPPAAPVTRTIRDVGPGMLSSQVEVSLGCVDQEKKRQFLFIDRWRIIN
jgi:hypothetical protein